MKDLSISASHHGLETWIKFLTGLRELWESHNYFKNKPKNMENFNIILPKTDVMLDYKLYFDLEDIENP